MWPDVLDGGFDNIADISTYINRQSESPDARHAG